MDTITEQHRLEVHLQYLTYQRDELERQIAIAYEALQAARGGDLETRPTPSTVQPFGGMLAIVWPSRKRITVNEAAPRPDNNSD